MGDDALTGLGRQLRGELLLPDDHGFAAADADRHRRWVQSLSGSIRYLAKGAYLNFLDAADEPRLHETYPDSTYRRLVEVKRRYDPTNLFHRNLNIRPA
jgi:FAD/FMN-containing dehydrogenase